MLPEESEALRRWRQGDPEGFEALYALAAPPLSAFCRLLAGGEAAAADLFQETWQKAVARIGAYREGRSFQSWLTAVAYHLWVDQERRRKTERRALEERLQASPQEAGSDDASDLQEILDRLPAGEREAVLLVDLQGFSLREAAEVLGVPRATLHERLGRAHEALARIL